MVAIVIWIGFSISCTLPGLLDDADHLLDRAHGVALEAEREREVEHRLRVGRPLDRVEERVVDLVHELAVHGREVADQPVVHEEPAPAAERMAIRLLHRGERGERADVREEERGDDLL